MANWWDSLAVPDSAFPKPAPSLPTPSQGAGTPSTPLLPAPPASNDLLASLRAGRDSQIAAMQQAASAPTPSLPTPPQPKPGFDLGNVGSALWEGATQQLLPGLKSAAAQAYTGINPVEPGSLAERWMAEGRQAQEQSQTRLEQLRQAGQTDSSSEAIREAMPSLGFSLVNMAGSLPAGLLVGAAGTAAGGPVAGGMAGSAAAGSVGAALGYRMAGSQLLNDSLAEMEKESQTQRGRGLSAEERNRAVEVLTPIAQDTGLWEAGPEFVGNAMMFGLGRVALGFLPKQSMAKLAQSALGRAGVRAAAGAGALGAEVATEGVTQFHQGPNQQRAGAATQAILAGQDPQAAIASVEPMYQGVEGLWQATKDVAPATIATVLMMGGIAKPIHMAGAAIENRRAGNARVDQAEQDTAALRANLDVANEQDIAQALSGFDQLETQGLPKHAAARLEQARQQLTRELELRASPESLAEPLETARGRAGYLGLAERADSLSDEQLLQAASRPLPQDVAPEIAKAHKMYGSALAKRQQWAKVAEGLTNPDAAKIMSSTLRQIVSGKPLTAGGYGSRDFNLASLSDDMLERYRLAADVLGQSDTASNSVQTARDALNQEAERRASGQRRDPESIRLSETAAKVALAPEAKIAGMLKGLSTEGLDRIAGRLNELATANPLLADRARSVLDQARQSRMQQFNPAGAQQAGITSAMQGWNQGQGRPAQPSPGRPVPAEQGQQPTAPIITRNIPTPAATGQSMLADALQRQQALQQEVAGLNQQPAAPTLPTPPQWGGSTLGGSSQPIQAAPQVGPSFAPQPLSGPAELTSLLGTNPPAPTLPTPAPPQGPTSLADLLGRDARLDVVPSSVSAQGPVAPPALTSRLPSLPNVQGRQTVQQAQAAPPVELSTGPEGARRGGTEGTGASENTPHGEIKTRSIDLSRSHAEIMGQIAERRDGMVYRSVKDIAAVRDVIDSGFVKDSSGAGVFASPRGAFAKYVFGPGKDTGYIIEMDNEGFEKAQNAGHDIKIFGYLKSDDPVPLRNVSRIIKITKDKTTPANNRAVSYQVIYSRESSENLTSAARGGQTGREAPQTTATSPQPEPSNAQERQTEAEAAPLLNQGQSAPAGTGAVENKQPKQKLVLWGFKPGTADAPIKLSQFSKGEQARRQKDGWTTAAYAEGDSPTGLIEQAKSARSTIAKPDITTSKNQKVVTAPFEDMIDESGNITRGGDYINKLLIPLSDAELEEVKVWSRKRSPQAARWIGDSVVAEQRTRNKKAEPNPAPTQKVVTVAGTETEVRPEVVELADLITSDDARFPKELQPRDRSRIASTEQISSIAARLDPMQLADSRLASDGAPIVGPDGVVESGNGRTLALREVYTRGRLKEKADAYRAMLAERGFDVAGMKEPVLIRRRVTSMTPTQRKTFTEEANARNIMGMSPAERALVHAGRLTPSLLDLYRGGDLTTLANGDFVRGFMAEVAMNESAEMMDAGGRLNQEGIRRIESAILARAYPNADLLGTLLESTDNNIKAIGGALLDSATGMVQLKSRIEKGLSPTELDITQPIVEASQLVAKARRDDVVLSELLSQSDMFGGGINPTAKRIVRLFFSDSDLKRQVSRDKIGYILNTYASQAKAIQRGDPLFQDAPTPTVGDLINALEDRSRATTRQQQASLLGGNPAGESRPPSQPEVQRPSTSPAGEPVGKPESGESRPAEGGKAEETDLGALFDQELEKAFANVPSPRESVEPGGENRPRENGMGESDVRAERPGTTGSPGRTGGRTDQGGPLEQGGAGVSDNAPAVPGKKGARRVRREDGTARTSDRVPGSDDTGRGGRTGSERVRTASKGRARPVQSAATPDAGVAPTAGEKAASAARETAAGLKATMDGLAALFGGKGKLSSGLTFDEDTYRQAVPFFRDAVRHFAQAAQDARESIRLLIKAMMDGGYNKEVIANMKPYAVRFIEDVQAGKINLAESSEQPAPPQSEPETIQPERLDLADKQTAQRRAESIAVEPRNPDNIRATLPFLLPEQQDDVLKAEQRFDQFNGILYTNATGTGKTYTGLGIIKRMVKQGKNNVLVIVPAQQKVSDWIEDGRNLGLDITGLPDTKTGGTGLVITTYANFRDNDGLSRRDWDLIVYDESHYLMSNQSATQTANLNRHNQLTLRPSGINRRARTLLSPADRTRLEQIEERARRSRGGVATYGREVEEEYEKLEQKVAEISAQLREKPNPKVVFLSATPFAYHKNIDYAEGLLFDWGPEPVSRGYNTPTARENFLITHFGYRMRTGKLTDPETDVDVDLMERRFHEWLKSTGAVSGRKLTIDRDYSREFVEIPDKIGPQIDRGINILSGYSPEGREKKNGREENKFSSLGLALKDSFDYFAKTRLLETIKAREAAQRAKQHVGLGRKVVVFHDYIEANVSHPFRFLKKEISPDDPATTAAKKREWNDEVDRFDREFPDLGELNLSGLHSTIDTFRREFGERVGFFNGRETKKARSEAIRQFNRDDSKIDVIVVQRDAGKEGISLHDVSGNRQRALIDLGLPTAPTEAIQTEGRIYRYGNRSDAIIEYLKTNTQYEEHIFGNKVATRTRTAENLAMGNEARNLQRAFIDAYLNSTSDSPNKEQGRDGKASDARANTGDPFDNAISFYFSNRKKTVRDKSAEGVDYYATPEPLGLKMVEWANLKAGESALEPSAGHGAIARFFPEDTKNTFIEPSPELMTLLEVNARGNVKGEQFENLHVNNKYDAIVMNPPFGSGGKTAIDHLEKAATHLRDGGRIVALLPEGPAADKRLEAFLSGDNGLYRVADIGLPTVTFTRAGTSVKTHIVVLEKHLNAKDAPTDLGRSDIAADEIKEFFEAIRHRSLPPRMAVTQPPAQTPSQIMAEVDTGGMTPAARELLELAQKEPVLFSGWLVEKNGRPVLTEEKAAELVGIANPSMADWTVQERAMLIVMGRYGDVGISIGPDANKLYRNGLATLGRAGMALNAAGKEALQRYKDLSGPLLRMLRPKTPATAPAEPTRSSSSQVAPSGPTTTLHVTTHAKKSREQGKQVPWFVVSLDRRVDRDTYQQLSTTAKDFGGFYSSYDKQGAIPGFQFPTKADAEAFQAKIASPAIRQSRPATTPRPATVAQARASLVKALGEKHVTALERAGRLMLHEKDPSKTGAAGYVDGKGIIHLIPANMDQTALDVALHEAMHLARDDRFSEGERAKVRLAHAALRLVGLKNFVGNPGFNDLVQQVRRMAAEGNKTAQDALAKARLEDPNNIDEEAIAYLAQYADEKLPLVRRVLAAIRAALYRMGIKVNLTPADVRALALSALKAQARAANREMMTARRVEAFSQPTTDEDAAEQERLWAEFQAVRAQFQARAPSETAFKRWFGKGTEGITARDGQPITLYHGTNNPEFNRWDETRAGQASTHPTSGLGFFMTADRRSAKRYGSRLMELHARINKPYYMTDADLTSIETVQDATRFRKKLLAQGYDGAVITAPGGAPYVVALESKQVKYTTNENPTESDDFRYSKPVASDAEYLAAVERGDLKAAQRMVDEAARAAGYNIGPVYHGTADGKWTTFRNKTTTSVFNKEGYFFSFMREIAEQHAKRAMEAKGKQGTGRVIVAHLKNPESIGPNRLTNGVVEYVVGNANQIKSADPITRDNAGNVIPLSQRFNAANNDIRYSRPGRPSLAHPREAAKVLGDIGELRDTIKPGEKALAKLNPTNWRQMLADLKANTRPQWLGLLTQDHLLELARKHLPAGAVRQFDDASERMEAYENRMIQAEGFPLADRWQTLMRNNRAQADALGLALHMSTWLGVDPRQTAAPKGKQVEWVRAKAALAALTNPEARKLYDDVLGFYANQTKRLFEELEQRIQRHSLPEPDKRAARDLLRQEFERMKDEGPYVPLMRFGDLTVWAEPRNPGEKPVFATLETVQDQRAFADWLKSQGYQPRLGVKMDEITKRALPAGDMVGKLTGIIDKNLKGPQADAIKDAMYQLFLRSLPEQAIRKHFLHRKFVPGYSADAIRTFATFARRSAKQVARLAHGDRMGGALDEMAKAVRDGTVNDPVAAGHLVNELDKSYQWSMDPQTADWASRLTHLGFMWHLGASPAHLLLNLGQQAQLTLPWLAGELHDKKGFAAVAAALGKANLDFLRTNPFTDPAKRGASAKTLRARLEGEYSGDLGRALKALEEAGKTDKSQTYSISGMSSEDQFLWSRPWLRKITQGAAWFFHTAEVINREASAIAAYRLGRESGMGHEAAYDLARRAINETHYDYSPGNRSRFMRGNVAKVITLFKQYALNTSWQLARNAYLSARGATPAEKAVARTKLRGMLGMTALMAGAVGMPFYNELAWMLTQLMTAFGDDDEPEWDFDTWFRRTLDDALNPTASEAARRGLVNAFVGIDLSSRIKLDDLWWRRTEDDQHGRQVAYSMLEQALGPVAGLAVRGISTVDGLWDALIEGTSARGASTRTLAEAMPKALKDISKSLRFATEGATTASGAPLMSREELGTGAIVGQAIGFRPAALTERQSANTAMLNLQDRIKRRRTAILDTLNMAVWQGDGEVIGALQSDIAAFNKRYPAMAITGDTIQNSIEAGARRRLELQLFGGAPLDRRLAPMLLSGEREE